LVEAPIQASASEGEAPRGGDAPAGGERKLAHRHVERRRQHAALQTADEQSGEHTNVHNKVGFNQVDAPFLTSIAKALPRYDNHMTPRQLAAARKMLVKYWRQLVGIANAAKIEVVERAQVEQHGRPQITYGMF